MDTQNTPIHMGLWNKEFWQASIANLLLAMSVYLFLPILPGYLSGRGYAASTIALGFLAFAIGIYIPGPKVSYLVERFRRNVVCITAMLMLAALFLFFFLFGFRHTILPVAAMFFAGMFFGLAEMVLLSTLVVDTLESGHRTEGNHAVTWFGRFALSVGPLAGLACWHFEGFHFLFAVAAALAALASVFVMLIHFPFRAPGETVCRLSLDRFFLPKGLLLYLNLMLITFSVGLLLSTMHAPHFFLLMTVGLVLALAAEKFVFANANLKSEAVSGCIMLGIAFALLAFRTEAAAMATAAVLTGLGTGLTGTRFLLFFVKLAGHMQRGSTQSTYFLGWETGLALGMSAGCLLHDRRLSLLTALAVVVIALIFYNYVVHPWYMQNKNR